MIRSNTPCVIRLDDWESQIRENLASSTDRESKETKVILIAEDDDDTYRITEEAFRRTEPRDGELRRVKDGEELMDYLLHEPRPSMILLDLNTPKKNGWAFRKIQSHLSLRTIPVVILSTSSAPPSSFEKMVTLFQVLEVLGDRR